MDGLEAQNLVDRARRIAQMYGPYDPTKPDFGPMMSELIYNIAEAMYYKSQALPALSTPFRSERIGSYSYDKGAQTVQQQNQVAADFITKSDIIRPLIIYLSDYRGPLVYGTRIEHALPANPDTGIRDIIIKAYDNRVARAIERSGLVSDTEEFNAIVYGDRYIGWP